MRVSGEAGGKEGEAGEGERIERVRGKGEG